MGSLEPIELNIFVHLNFFIFTSSNKFLISFLDKTSHWTREIFFFDLRNSVFLFSDLKVPKTSNPSSRYFKEILNYIDMEETKFHELCDSFRSPHLWIKTDSEWKLRHTVNKDGYND